MMISSLNVVVVRMEEASTGEVACVEMEASIAYKIVPYEQRLDEPSRQTKLQVTNLRLVQSYMFALIQPNN